MSTTVRSLYSYLLMAVLLLAGCAGTENKTDEFGATEESPADLYVKLAWEYLRAGQLETSLDKINTALEEDNKNPLAHNVAAIIYQRLGKEDLAEKHFREALRLSPNNAYVLNAWGNFLCSQKKFEDADQQYAKVVKNPLYPTPWMALTNAGRCARLSGDTARAEEYYTRALTMNPYHAEALLSSADLHYQRGAYKTARDFIERYFRVARPTPQSLLLAVRVERKLSRKRARAYEKALRDNFPGSPEVILLEAI